MPHEPGEKMRLLMAINSLALGGAERFFVNLATALAQRHEVRCYIPALACSHTSMVKRLGGLSVESLRWFTPSLYRIFYKAVLTVQKTWPAFDPEQRLHTRRLCAMQRKHSFHGVNAQLMPAARQVCAAFEHTKLPITKSDHGDTALYDREHDAVVMHRLDALICPATANAQKARDLPLRSDCRVTTIPYGYSGTAQRSVLPLFAGVTFGMVARGVRDKGWEELLLAASLVHEKLGDKMRLVLVGDGPEIARLRAVWQQPWIIFAGEQSEPAAWVAGFDVGLLPSCLPEESLPNSVIEYLAAGKPVVATQVGGIPEMIRSSGLLVPLSSQGRAEVSQLAEAMLTMADERKRSAYADYAAQDFSQFSMERCVTAYEHLFQSLSATHE